ncbi:ribose 5-phosphate isomerase B [Helicobacter saguini]|uniref:Ribose 5-phosphate isomerase B n=1 Tax=Helicobacter saguini TaxID=1548018 RepID=A0A347VPC0_9HELI|nr:ribose 5-phosphate isomerase B [Helicobacter saguini]MWV61427.1 ribose 5-phosphate isomerase B [Helicobacter saguini]MWV67903.1 ribose 5-phosphate isomerase B [Helicobacter saguini]MWV70629.1 ribose 5-phosphate isomerase B [Helicobacter saguini]MWV72533.1 ribose 5-phosphate isomerase B [Helicobacter saguini]TLD94728.1 ribose 5-phosphate isomerase B [Helicobacter saguini]
MIFIANDHAGVSLKNAIITHFGSRFEMENLGVDSINSVDYPDIAAALCEKVALDSKNLGILICGSGIGMSIAANRHKNIRAALCLNSFMAEFARRHNDANVLCLGERVVGVGLALSIVESFLDSSFEGGRHKRRVDKLGEL